MEWISKSNILIVGLGLMGGCYAKALKRLGYRVTALTRRQETIDYAVANGIIDEGRTGVDEELIGRADAVIFALYPNVFKDWIRDNQHLLKPGALLTDVTGVKRCIVYDIQAMLRPDVEFIAAHPMAGREVYGVENSDDRIFREANYIVTPTPQNTPEAIEWCRSLGQILGFRKVSILTPEEHDEMIGFLSQLTPARTTATLWTIRATASATSRGSPASTTPCGASFSSSTAMTCCGRWTCSSESSGNCAICWTAGTRKACAERCA